MNIITGNEIIKVTTFIILGPSELLQEWLDLELISNFHFQGMTMQAVVKGVKEDV